MREKRWTCYGMNEVNEMNETKEWTNKRLKSTEWMTRNKMLWNEMTWNKIGWNERNEGMNGGNGMEWMDERMLEWLTDWLTDWTNERMNDWKEQRIEINEIKNDRNQVNQMNVMKEKWNDMRWYKMKWEDMKWHGMRWSETKRYELTWTRQIDKNKSMKRKKWTHEWTSGVRVNFAGSRPGGTLLGCGPQRTSIRGGDFEGFAWDWRQRRGDEAVSSRTKIDWSSDAHHWSLMPKSNAQIIYERCFFHVCSIYGKPHLGDSFCGQKLRSQHPAWAPGHCDACSTMWAAFVCSETRSTNSKYWGPGGFSISGAPRCLLGHQLLMFFWVSWPIIINSWGKMMIHFEVFIAWGPQNQVMFLEEISRTRQIRVDEPKPPDLVFKPGLPWLRPPKPQNKAKLLPN